MVETYRLIYCMTMFGHRKGFEKVRAYTGVPGGYRNPPRSLMGHMGLSGEREGWPGQAARPSPSGLNWTKGRGGAPSFLLFSFPFLLS